MLYLDNGNKARQIFFAFLHRMKGKRCCGGTNGLYLSFIRLRGFAANRRIPTNGGVGDEPSEKKIQEEKSKHACLDFR